MGSRRVIKYMVAIVDFLGEKSMKSGLLIAIAVGGLLFAGPASAQGVKIGVLNDQSGVYADYGAGGFEAAKMAVEDFGGSVLTTRSRSSPPTTRTSLIWLPVSRGAGMRSKAST